VKRYPVAKLLGVRRAGNVAPAMTMSIEALQRRLKDLGYHEVGQIDGKVGPRTRAAILAFRDDNDLALVPIIDVALTDALTTATPRAVAPERAAARPEGSRILAASNAQIALGAAGYVGIAISDVAPLVGQAEEGRDLATRLFDLVGLGSYAPVVMPLLGVAIFFAVIVLAWKARAARIDDHRSGKTP
jgi:peptidoglycan hydrolase-like protein with peptidoglycan-binding domain